jgi:ATP-dependent RNA helicase SUPV3L1/SUV3
VRVHPRLSELRYVGSMRLEELPPRTAVVAFSANAVYEHAESLRDLHGGAAVVLGAMSPRTRNAQVELYQSGEVDHIVATDAIGMGLNMDIDMVAFAALRKFDGLGMRDLEPGELAQIAGRAGRAWRGGSFCTLSRFPLSLPASLSQAIERHQFAQVEHVRWRANARDLDFSSIDSLVHSLAAPSPGLPMMVAQQSEDLDALIQLGWREDIREIASAGSVELLWSVCQVPNFQRAEFGHIDLLAQLYQQLATAEHVDEAWLQRSLDELDNVNGNLDTLMGRLAAVRTWTYISNRAAWLRDAEVWRERTRSLEDRLSDALHERLVARFVDRKRKRGTRRPAPLPSVAVDDPPTRE